MGQVRGKAPAIVHGPPLAFPPGAPRTLVDALRQSAERYPTHTVTCIRADRQRRVVTYPQLLDRATRVLAGLRRKGIEPGDHVILMTAHTDTFIESLWGCLLGGIVAGPIPPADAGSTSVSHRPLDQLWESWDRPWIVTDEEGRRRTQFADGMNVITIENCEGLEPADVHQPVPDDRALMLFTSGSTGRPKRVPLTHGNLLAMAEGSRQANGFSAEDVTFNWMPMSHVGAISFLHTLPTYVGCSQVHVETSLIMRDVIGWLDLLSEYEVSVSWAPNFAFRLLLERPEEIEHRSWDLSRLWFVANAGENVSVASVREFCRLMERFGLRETAIRPAFGMSETCSGITWATEADACDKSAESARANLGPPISGASLRIVDEHDSILPEEETGRLQLKGPSVFLGYDGVDADSHTADGWFTTGDLGFLRSGKLHLAGREKGTIIHQGDKFADVDIESAVEAVDGVETASAAAIAYQSSPADAESLVVFFAGKSNADRIPLRREVRRAVTKQFGINPSRLIELERNDIPRTSIGKINRAELRRRLEAGEWAADAHPERLHLSREEWARRLEEVWRDLLGLDRVDRDRNFFDLGGTSAQIAELEGRLADELNVRVPATTLMAHPTIQSLANILSGETATRSSRRSRSTSAPGDGWAIVGMACRFPGADNVDEFWDNLCQGAQSITNLSDVELMQAGVEPWTLMDPHYVRSAPLIDGMEWFDPAFFNMTQSEATGLDPQQRLFLECCWETLEDAGYDPARYAGRIGVFASASQNAYAQRLGFAHDAEQDLEAALLAGAPDFVPMRASYKLDLRGPSVNVQTACSSSLVALDLATKSLTAGECDMALVGAVNIWLLDQRGYRYRPGGLVSPDGLCRPFDASANGMVFGNGMGAILIKPLADAMSAGDRIVAVLRSVAVNNDGSQKIGFLATGIDGQRDVIIEAMERAQRSTESLVHVECHGTGTLLGDAIEATALTRAIDAVGRPEQPIPIGSVKANIGHMGVACGMAGLMKTALILDRGKIPPTPLYQSPNPHIPFERAPIAVATAVAELPSIPTPCAGVSSFGLGGTNAHAILERVSAEPIPKSTNEPQSLVISGKSAKALANNARRLAWYLRRHPKLRLEDVCWTLQVGRGAFAYRMSTACRDLPEAIDWLESTACQTASVEPLVDFERPVLAVLVSADDLDFVQTLRDDGVEFRGFVCREKNVAAIQEALHQRGDWFRAEGSDAPDRVVPAWMFVIDRDEWLRGEPDDRGGLDWKSFESSPLDSSGAIWVDISSGRVDTEFPSNEPVTRSSARICADIWRRGGPIRWELAPAGGRRVSLPTYAFERVYCWVDRPTKSDAQPTTNGVKQSIADERRAPVEESAPIDWASLPPEEWQASIEAVLVNEVRRLVGKGPSVEIDRQAGLIDLGVRSRDALELMSRLERILGSVLPLTALLDYPTIADLADYLEADIRARLAKPTVS